MSLNLKSFIKVTLISGGIFAVASCGVTAEQLAELQRLRRAEAELQDKIEDVNAESRKLKDELKVLEDELKDCNTKTAYVKEKLDKWGSADLWSDGWTPEK